MSINFAYTSSEYLRLMEALKGTTPWSLSMWIYPSDGSADRCFFYLGYSLSSKVAWSGWVRSTANGNVVRFQLQYSTTIVNVDTTSGVTRNAWNHIAIVEVSTTDHRVFLNGGSKGSSSTSIDPSTGGYIDETTIAAVHGGTPASFFDGRVEHMGFWDVALSDAEVEALGAGRVSPLQIDVDNLQNYYPFNDVSVLRDLRGSNSAFTAYNTPTTAESAPVPKTIVAP